MLRYGMVWRGMVYGMVWYGEYGRDGMVWCGVVRYGMVTTAVN